MDYITTFESIVTQQLSHSLTIAKSIHVRMFIDIFFSVLSYHMVLPLPPFNLQSADKLLTYSG